MKKGNSCFATRSLLWSFSTLFFGALTAGSSFAWVYPEHRDITVLTVEKLSPDERVILDGLWAEARTGHEKRLCAQAADATQAEKPSCIDWAAWPAISGDHSCSAAAMVDTVLKTDWILGVADVAATLKRELAAANAQLYQAPAQEGFASDLMRRLDSEKVRARRVNALRDSDIRLQRVDQEYATRAESNNVHFLLARPRVDIEGIEYVMHCLSEGAELNALGAYAWYHVSALEKASRLSRGGLSPEQRAVLAQATLADEAFAIHFLEDTFASGHVAGTWGDASQRKGTHDYYNEHGLEAVPWKWEGKSFVLMGDAYMRPEDAERAAEEVRKSLEQVLDAAIGRGPAGGLPYDMPSLPAPDSFDVCGAMTMPKRIPAPSPDVYPLLGAVIQDVPVPGLGLGAGSLPRFRSELGPFVGMSAALYGRAVDGGFGKTQTTSGAIGGLEAAVRFGMGLEGVMNEAGDGLVFLDLGLRLDSPSSMNISDASAVAQFGAISAAIPSRSAYTVRLRMPFWIVPGDLLLALPVLAISPDTYAKMAVTAGNGGLIPWQSGIATPVGRFQFVLGREVGISFYGYRDDDRVIIPSSVPGGSATLISLRSTAFDFPIIEYRPFRTFSLDQSSGLLVQLFGGFDIPRTRSVIDPAGAPEPDLKTVWYGGIRIVFDWRSYL
jgi:hypothetical protein